MDDYKNYSYSDTLIMLDGWYDHDTEDVNYAQVLLSMNGCNTINDCIKVYKRVYEKYQKYMNSTSQSGHKEMSGDCPLPSSLKQGYFLSSFTVLLPLLMMLTPDVIWLRRVPLML